MGERPPSPSVTVVSERELSKAERKKARRKERAASDRAGGQALDELADATVDEALQLVTRVAEEGELGFSTEVKTPEAARYCLKRINDALRMDEWLDEVEVWVWNAHTSVRRPMTPGGETNGVELRIEPRID